MPDIGAMYLDEALLSLRGIKRQADSAMEQLNDEQFFAMLEALRDRGLPERDDRNCCRRRYAIKSLRW